MAVGHYKETPKERNYSQIIVLLSLGVPLYAASNAAIREMEVNEFQTDIKADII
jgi:hypothetical protein